MEETPFLNGKNALVLTGSPRQDGFTAKLVQCFMENWFAYVGSQNTVTIIDAYKTPVKPCINCGYCKRIQGCRYDDFIPIDKALKETDLLVIASPVYFLGFPAPLKAIFDRTQQYFEAKLTLRIKKPIQKYKPAIFLTSFGSKDNRGVMMMQEQLYFIFLLMNASLKHTLAMSNTDDLLLNMASINDEMKHILLDIKKELQAV